MKCDAPQIFGCVAISAFKRAVVAALALAIEP
jgi:hypothetical protein